MRGLSFFLLGVGLLLAAAVLWSGPSSSWSVRSSFHSSRGETLEIVWTLSPALVLLAVAFPVA